MLAGSEQLTGRFGSALILVQIVFHESFLFWRGRGLPKKGRRRRTSAMKWFAEPYRQTTEGGRDCKILASKSATSILVSA